MYNCQTPPKRNQFYPACPSEGSESVRLSLTADPRPLAPDLIMQNKPNSPAAQMNVTSFYTMDYENTSNWKLGENKANLKIPNSFFRYPHF